MYIFSQGQIFIIFLIIGITIGVLFDCFRASRKEFKTSDFITFIEDILFTVISGFLFINNLIIINNGEIRFYIIMSLFFGLIIYFFTISKLCVIIFQYNIRIIKKIIFLPFFLKNILMKKKDFRK